MPKETQPNLWNITDEELTDKLNGQKQLFETPKTDRHSVLQPTETSVQPPIKPKTNKTLYYKTGQYE